jgi:hypothetical protein
VKRDIKLVISGLPAALADHIPGFDFTSPEVRVTVSEHVAERLSSGSMLTVEFAASERGLVLRALTDDDAAPSPGDVVDKVSALLNRLRNHTEKEAVLRCVARLLNASIPREQ